MRPSKSFGKGKEKDKKGSKSHQGHQGKRGSKPAAQKRPRSDDGEEKQSHAAASRAGQFRETKLHRKSVSKPDSELLEQAKVIYNVVKPNDVSCDRHSCLLFVSRRRRRQ